jgi:RNA recognition motif-containing protein
MQDNKKLFVGNLSWGLDDAKLAEVFSAYGEVTDAKVITERGTGRSKGFGFVTFATEEQAAAAIEGLNEKDVEGRNVTVNVAQPPKPRD